MTWESNNPTGGHPGSKMRNIGFRLQISTLYAVRWKICSFRVRRGRWRGSSPPMPQARPGPGCSPSDRCLRGSLVTPSQSAGDAHGPLGQPVGDAGLGRLRCGRLVSPPAGAGLRHRLSRRRHRFPAKRLRLGRGPQRLLGDKSERRRGMRRWRSTGSVARPPTWTPARRSGCADSSPRRRGAGCSDCPRRRAYWAPIAPGTRGAASSRCGGTAC